MYTQEKAIQILIQSKFLEEVDSECMEKAGVFSAVRSGPRLEGKDAIMRHYVQRLSVSESKHLYKQRRECRVAEIIGILYMLGIGLPKSSDCCDFWFHRSRIPSGSDCPVFVDFSNQLKEHLSKVFKRTSGYLYDHTTRRLEKASKLNDLEAKQNIVPAVLVYRLNSLSYSLHNVIIDYDTYVYSLPDISEVPKTINVKSHDRYVLVSGVLMPTDKFEQSKLPLAEVLKRHLRSFEIKKPGNEKRFSRTLVFGRTHVYTLSNDWALNDASFELVASLKQVFKVLKSK